MSGWPDIEYEECYPVDEEFASVTATEPRLDFKAAGAWLLRELPRAAENMCCSCKVMRTKDRWGKAIHRIYFSTGGWSGAESIIRLIERRVDLSHCMESWRRGGHYVFEVPIEKEMRSISEIRKQAWATRRAKYGERGHCGSYSRYPTPPPIAAPLMEKHLMGEIELIALAERYRLVQDGMVVAEASGPGSRAEIGHYYSVYSQDGPCHIEKKGAKRWTRLRAIASQEGE